MLDKLNQLVWGPLLLTLLIGTGVYLIIRLKGLPIRNLFRAIRFSLDNDDDKNKISPFAALTCELASTIGTGNIIGVLTAIVIGGPGALFWMLVISFLGLGIKLVESTLSIKYRVTLSNHVHVGGPMYVCANQLQNKRIGKYLGITYAILAVCSSIGMGNMTQANTIADSIKVLFGVRKELVAVVLFLLVLMIIAGGKRGIFTCTRYLVPFMGIFYMIGAIFVIIKCGDQLPTVISNVLIGAFYPGAIGGAVAGSTFASFYKAFQIGISRGIFSNEAGLGASGISASAVESDDYIKQGYISMTGVFWDTIVMCTITGIAFLSSGILQTADIKDESYALFSACSMFEEAFPGYGNYFIAISLSLFSFATIIAWAYQGEVAFCFLYDHEKHTKLFFRILYSLMVIPGCLLSFRSVWLFSDVSNGLMAFPNLFCLLCLSKEICSEINRYPIDRSKEKLRRKN